MLRRSWVEVNLSILEENIRVYKSCLPDNIEIMAVVKADAYGHGDRRVAKYISDRGIHNFAVSNIDEAIHIREAGADGQILILGYTPVESASELVKYDITQALLSEEYASLLAHMTSDVKCQFAIDTGMRRIGLNADNPVECERIIREYARKMNLTGIFTHLCAADTPDEQDFTETQVERFNNVVRRVEDLNLPYHHYMNSAGGLWHQKTYSSFARLGIIMYGLKPDYLNSLPEGIKPVLAWKSVVSMVKTVMPGDTIGYGRSYVVERPLTIATIPTGYADGYSRLLSNKGWVIINGKKAPIVGRVCMDQMMVDITDISDVQLGSEVTLIGIDENETITADDLAHVYGTIGYEIVCGISKRVPRVYVNQEDA